MKCIHVCAAQKLIYSIKPDFPSLADEIAEPHPDMNIKVDTLTVSEKSSKTNNHRDSNSEVITCFVLNLSCSISRSYIYRY